MITKVSQKVTDRLLSRNVIKDEDYEIYQYGLEQIFTSIMDLMTLLAIGVIMGMIWQCIIFVLSFMLLRKYAGGYHASTPLRCYLLTTLIITVALSVMKYIEINYFIYWGLFISSSIVTFLLSPMESENKRLDDIERIVYRKQTFLIWCAEVSIAVIFVLFKFNEMSICIITAELTLGLSQIIGNIEKHNRKL